MNPLLLLGLGAAGLYLMRRRMADAAPAPVQDGQYAAPPRRPYSPGRPSRGHYRGGPGYARPAVIRYDDYPGYRTLEIQPWRDDGFYPHRDPASWWTPDMPPINLGDWRR